MNLNCAICSEVFLPAHDPYVTPCGHVFHNQCLKQWMNISQTCPQCRNTCTTRNIFRLYFNVSNSDNSIINDYSTLQQKCDSLSGDLLEKNKNLFISQKKIENLEEKVKTLRTNEAKRQKELDHKKLQLLTQQTATTAAIEDNKRLLLVETEYKKLKNDYDLFYKVQNVISGSVKDVEQILQQNNNINTLAVLIAALKRELKASEQRRDDIKNSLKETQKECHKMYTENKLLKEKLSQFESDNYHLKQEVKRLEQDVLLGSYYSTDSDISAMINAGPSNNVKTPKLIDLTSPKVLTSTSSPATSKGNISLEAKKITESTSPYLYIKSSNVGLAPILKYNKGLSNKRLYPITEEKNKTDDKAGAKDEFLIFKRPRMNDNMGVKYINLKNSQPKMNQASVNTNGTLQPAQNGNAAIKPFIRFILPSSNTNGILQSTSENSNNKLKLVNNEKKLEELNLTEIKEIIMEICKVSKKKENLDLSFDKLIKLFTDSITKKDETNVLSKSVSSRIKNGQLKKQTFAQDGNPPPPSAT